MILTVTMNPSIDMSYQLSHLNIGQVTRSQSVSKTAGGKGLNVARVIKLMGYEPIATGILGGHFGAFIEDKLNIEQIRHSFSHINQETRNSIALLHDQGKQTEILESGPKINNQESQKFLEVYKKLLKKVGLVTISGSLPPGLEKNYYAQMIDLANKQGVEVLLDSSGPYLKQGVFEKNKPYLIKPNEDEIGQLTGTSLTGENFRQLPRYLSSGQLGKLPWIVVSLGAKGALAKHNHNFYRAKIPKIKAINPVGSGDSTLAGLAIGISKNENDENILKTGMTTGILNTLEKKTGCVNRKLFKTYFSQVKIEKIEVSV